MKQVLFLCNQNRLRSPTAEALYKGIENLEVRSAGLDDDAVKVVSGELIEWADIIFVMEESHEDRLSKKFGQALKGKEIICLDIPDEYLYMDPHLVMLLTARLKPYLGPPSR